MTQCMDVLNRINQERGTHQCPTCRSVTYCAIDAGKSATTCWCMTLPHTITPNDSYSEKCLCHRCLINESDVPVTGIQDASRRK